MKLVKKWLGMIWSDKQLLVGVVGILLLLFIITFEAVLAPCDPYAFDYTVSIAPGTVDKDINHIMGTNSMGQDVFSMLIYGCKTSLKVALISALISGILGILIGGIAGLLGGKVDLVISETINIFLMIPTFFLIMLVVAMFGSSITNVMVVIGLTSWPGNAKLMRSQALSIRERVYVKSATALGETKWQILFKYILPNGIYPVVANTTRGMAGAILTEASLSFLGLGDPNIISWGQMIYQGKQYVTTAWWVAGFAGIAVIITVIIFYMLGDGLNHVLNPKYIVGGKK